jgi:hypothetical protein
MNEAPVDFPDVRGWSLVSGSARVAFGVAMLASPEWALRALGFTEASPATVVACRLAGGRDLVLGLMTLASLDDADRLRAQTLANAAADAGDVAAFAGALGAGERAAGLRGLAAALPATLAGLWTARRLG